MLFAVVLHAVRQLTDDDFDSFLSENGLTMVKMYAPWCGHCKALAPKWEALAEQVTVPVVEVDCTVSTKTCGRYGVRGYPAIKFVSKELTYEYDGARETDAMKKWVNVMLKPMFEPITEEQVIAQAAAEQKTTYFILYAPASQTGKYETFLSSLKGSKTIFFVSSSTEQLVAVREGVRVVHTQMTTGAMKQFIENNQFGFLPELTEGYKSLTTRPNKQLLVLCYSKDYHQEIADEIKQLEKDSVTTPSEKTAVMSKFTLAGAPHGDSLNRFIEQFKVPEGDAPFLVFFDGKVEKEEKYLKIMLEEGDYAKQTLQAMRTFNKKMLIGINDTEAKPEQKTAEKAAPAATAQTNDKQIEMLKNFIGSKFAEQEDKTQKLLIAVVCVGLVQVVIMLLRKPKVVYVESSEKSKKK
ncbi:Protein_disulfide isomerase PDI2 [Hexamita inflata]|uniref:Protein disulfide isomerase PDI2 n=1 Tax=Hexamita inflata TaxID=28002 RepID=A0AA86NN40_9EUKA|nr:Protein disulfide isomerase PDI2 [Hexamita inflata]